MVFEYRHEHCNADQWQEAWIQLLGPETLVVKTTIDLFDGPSAEYGHETFEVRLVSAERQKEIDESPDDWWMHEDSSLEKSSSLEKRLELLQA